ncbi:MAG: hypothetical protein P1V51_00930 [Deltaproteobacteria bacterium]|nr:hypothetical protein [Deltaproteobacteria bacterium]
MFRPIPLLLVLALSLTAAPALAQQVAGPRALGMGEAHRGVGLGNDTLFLNPAGMSLAPRYVIESFFRHDSGTKASLFSISLIDSKSGPVAGGLAYTYEWVGEESSVRAGSRVDMGSSYALAKFLLFGITMHYHGLQTAEGQVNRVTGDTGFLIVPASFISIGITGHNVINPVPETNAAPRMFGGGINLRIVPGLNLAFDWRKSVEIEGKPAAYHFGGEYYLGQSFPIRAGYTSDEVLDQQRWSLGLGVALPSFGLDVSYSRTIRSTDRVQVFAVGIYLVL